MALKGAEYTRYNGRGNWAKLYDVQRLLGFAGQLRIPRNQRMYSWTNKQVMALIKDLEANKSTHTANKKEFFSLGTIDMKKTSERVPQLQGDVENDVFIYDVFDGQQRLTTLCLMSIAGAHSFARFDGEDALTDLRTAILRGGNPLLHFDYDELNTAFKLLCSDGNIDGYDALHDEKPTGVHRMKETYDTVKNYLDDKGQNQVESFHNHMMAFTEIVFLNSKASGFVMFETRNNRGINPNELDLVKNFIEQVDEKYALGLDFGSTNWRDAMNLRDKAYLNGMSDQITVNQVNRGENALLGRAQTVTTGAYLGQGKYENFYSRFKSLLNTNDADKVAELTSFITAFNEMSKAMAEVLAPANGWMTYGSLETYKPVQVRGEGARAFNTRVSKFKNERGHSLAILADIFSRLDIEATWQVVVLALYTRVKKIEDFNRCLRQIEKAAFRVYRFRGQSRNDFARNELSKLAQKIYNWDVNDQQGLVCFTLSAIGYICVEKAGSSLSDIYTELTTLKNHYQTKWCLYLLYHYEVAQYPSLMLGSVTKSWNYSKAMATGTGTDNIKFEKEHIMPQNLFPDSNKIRIGQLPAWLTPPGGNNNAIESDGQSYWTRKWSSQKDSIWFKYLDADDSEKKESFDAYNGYRHCIGNLVMSKGELNVRYSNNPYARLEGDNEINGKKRQYLVRTDFRRVKNISRIYKEWNKRTIKDRAHRIACWAIQRFQLELCDNPGNYPGENDERTVESLFEGVDILEVCEHDDLPETPLIDRSFIPEHTDAFRNKCIEQKNNPEQHLGQQIPEQDEEEDALYAHNEPAEIPHPEVDDEYLSFDDDELKKIYDFPETFYSQDLGFFEEE